MSKIKNRLITVNSIYYDTINVIVSTMDNTVGSLTKLERSVIFGSILGDGYIRIIPGRNDAFLEVNHSLKAREYVDFKYQSLKRLVTSPPKARVTNDGRNAYRFFTKQHKDITALYKLFYKNGKKTIPEVLKLDPISIAVWYMDDGSRSRDRDIYINTQQFSLNDQRKLLHVLRSIGVQARLNKDKKYYRIRILKDSIGDFMKIVSPYVIPSMKYKLVMTL